MNNCLCVCVARELKSFRVTRPAVSVSVSQRGLVGTAYGRSVQVWKDLFLKGSENHSTLYLTHQVPADVNVLEFSPYEDCLGIGHALGFSSILVPGWLLLFLFVFSPSDSFLH